MPLIPLLRKAPNRCAANLRRPTECLLAKLKQRLKEEGNETVTNCHGLKMLAQDGKMRITDVADTEQLFRLIQSIPSPKAEPFKLWLAKVASERLVEMQDPELSIDRALENYMNLGYSENCLNQRLLFYKYN